MADSGDRPRADADVAAGGRELIARLACRRVEAGLSQARMARLMQTSQPAVARLESGRHDVALSTLARYARALGLAMNFVEDTAVQAGSSTAGSAAAAETGRAGQVSLEQPQGAASPDVVARPKGRSGRKPKEHNSEVITETPDQPDPDHVLTWRQRKVLQFIRDSVQERGCSPSLREIGEAVGLASTSSVAFQLATLRRKGFLQRRPQTAEVRLPGGPARPEPGREEDETAEMPDVDVFRLPWELIGGEDTLFVIKVVGDSMNGAAIFDGDWAVVRQQSSAQGGNLRDGDLVAADIDGVPGVRTYEHSGEHIILVPHNRAYAPILADEKVSIRGRVIAVLRSDRPAA